METKEDDEWIDFTQGITKDTVEEAIKKHGIIDPNYESDDEFRDKVKLTGTGIDFKALKAGQDIEFELDPSKAEDDYNWEDENDKIDYENIFKYRNQDMVMPQSDDSENEEDSEKKQKLDKQSMTPFEVIRLKMVDISPEKDGGVMKRQLESGTGILIPNGSRVRIHYNAYFELNDEPFDSTYLRNKSFEFKLGAHEVVAGLDVAVATMKKREKSQFIFEPDFYCGTNGCEPRVPKNTAVLFEIEVISFIEANAYDSYELSSYEQRKKLTLDQILQICNCLRELGNDSFQRKNYREASKKYRKSIYLLDNVSVQNDEEEKRWKSTMLKLYLNMSQICLNQTKPKKSIYYCKLALDMDPQNVKALFRYGSSLRLLQDFDRSRKFLLKAYNLSPSDKSISAELERLDDMIARYKNTEKEMYQKMFNLNIKSKKPLAIDSNNNNTASNSVPKEMIMEEKRPLEKSKELILNLFKEFLGDTNSTVYNFQIDMYSTEIVHFIREQARAYNLETREIDGTAKILQIMKK